MRVTEVVEGGYLDLGVEKYQVRFEVIEKQKDEGEAAANSCIMKATVEYQTKDMAAAALALNSIQTFLTIMNTVADSVTKNSTN